MSETVKLTNREVLESALALAELSKIKLPAKTAYAVAKALNKLADLEKPVRVVQKGLWEKYGEKDETGNLKINKENGTFSIPAANGEAFLKEHNELLEEQNDVSGIRKLKLSELDGASFEASLLIHLDWFVADE